MAENRPPARRSTIPPPIERVEPAGTPDLLQPLTHLATDVVVLPPENPRHMQRDARSDPPPPSYAPKPGVVARRSTIPARDNDVDSPMPEARPARSPSTPAPAHRAEPRTDVAEKEVANPTSQTTLADIDRDESDAPKGPVRTMTVKMTAVSSQEPRGLVSNAVADAVPTGLPAARVLPQPLDPRLVLLIDPDSTRSASYRSLRDILLGKGLPRVLAITSARPNEGKTTCAINLALALAEQPPTRVLLLDGNFFSPSLGGIFAIDASTSEATSRARRPGPHAGRALDLGLLAPYRIAEISGGLHVAAVVRESGEPVRRFDSRWLEKVVGHLRASSYDHVIIDAAALEGSPSVTQLIAVADATLLTVRASASTTGALRRAAQQIPPTRGIGVVLMDA